MNFENKPHLYFLAFTLTMSSVLGTVTSFAGELKSITANGVEVEYVEQGNGPLMILAHGSIHDHRRWVNDHLPLLSRNYRVISYTMRYHGDYSKWDTSWPPLSMDLYADDLAAFIESLNAGPAHLVGWSMGANVVHRAALKHPDFVKSAYLYEGAAAMQLGEAESKEVNKLRELMFGKSISLSEDKQYTKAVGALVDAVVGKDGFFVNLPPETQNMMGLKGMVLADYFKAFSNPVTTYTCDEIKRSNVPTLLVVGENTTDYFSVAFGKYTSCLGSHRIEVIPGANHIWPAAKLEDFVQSVHEFASRH